MSYEKQGLKALGVSFLAALGLMGFAAPGAQGSGKVLVSGLAPPFTVGITGEDHTPENDRMWILNLNLEIICHSSSIDNGLLTSSGHGSATFLLEECLVQGVNGAGALVGSSCELIPSTIEGKALALIILHSGGAALGVDLALPSGSKTEHSEGTGNPYVLFTPPGGIAFSTVINENEECLLPEAATIRGCYVAKLVTSGDQVTHLIETREMLALFGCELKYGVNVAHLETDGLAQLTNSVHGSHAGLKWGVE